MNQLLDRIRFISRELVLGTMIALLSVGTAVASFQGAMADSEQNKFEIAGMKALNDGNAEYLTGNQVWIQDDSNFDNYYINRDRDPELADYYYGNFTEELDAAIERNGEEGYPIDDEYVDAIYASAYAFWEESDTSFDLGAKWDERGDMLQLVVMIMALGLAFSAWASLLKEESNMRLLFSLAGMIMFVYGLIVYIGIPNVS